MQEAIAVRLMDALQIAPNDSNPWSTSLMTYTIIQINSRNIVDTMGFALHIMYILNDLELYIMILSKLCA
jgi:hypothetical protein